MDAMLTSNIVSISQIASMTTLPRIVLGQFPPRQLPPGQLPPANSPRDNCPQDNNPPRQLPPGQLPPKANCPPDNSPLGLLPPGQLPPRQLPPYNCPLQIPSRRITPLPILLPPESPHI